jgi:hypothetical protein
MTTHNLNIHMYSFQEILDLFQLPSTFGEQELKRAKMIVLKMHPDKSRLPPEYFLFYKKAFEFVVDYYRDSIKTSTQVPTEEIVYEPITVEKQMSRKIQSTMKEIGTEQFQNKFNRLFEENMAKKIDESQNAWFKSNDPIYSTESIQNASGIGQAIDQIKERNAALIKHRGVESIVSGNRGNSLYDNDSGDHDDYVTCDPFSKLKFDDLRKVHKDQTVFAVGERDFAKVRVYGSTDELQKERGTSMKPLEKSQAERMLLEQEARIKQQMLAKQHAASLRSLEYEKKNRSVLSTFLQLSNGT